MAVKKATTTDDLTAGAESEDSVKYVKVKAPFSGAVTEVPEGIVEALLESGYSKSK